MDPIKEAKALIAELESVREEENKRQIRLLDEVKKTYEAQEKTSLSRFEPILKKMKLENVDVEDFYKVSEADARSRLEKAVPRLQLTKQELPLVEAETRSVLAIDPCYMVHSTTKCVQLASSGYCSHWETANALGSCGPSICAPGNNECNPRVEAFGQATGGYRAATVNCGFYFYVPARLLPAMVDVNVRVALGGLYVLQAGTFGSSQFTLELEARGYQYGYSWGSTHLMVVNHSGNTMGRFDDIRNLNFNMPVGANDPFLVRVSATLNARANKGGSMAVGDFSSGAGNFLKVIYVNTYSDP
jgi:hypothetical protein